MAATKKAAFTALNRLDLTRAKDEDKGKLSVGGAAAKQLGREYNDLDSQIRELEEKRAELRQQIVELVGQKRAAAEAEGRYYGTAQIDIDDAEFLQVMWTDRFRPLDSSHQPLLRRAFGKHYQDLFQETFEAKVASDAKIEDLQAALGTRAYDTLQKFVSVSPAVKLKKGFRETRANLRSTFDETTNASIDTVVAKVAYSPTLKPVRSDAN